MELFLVFFRIGAFTFGGGFAMIPLMRRELAEKKKWITDDEMADIFSLAQTAPGVISVNSATILGYKTCGFWGAFVSTLGVVLPSFITISVIALFFEAFKSIKIVSYAFWGIRSAVVLMIFDAALKLGKGVYKDWLGISVAAGTFLAVTFLGISAVYVLLFSIISGIIVSKAQERRGQKANGAD